MKRKDLIVTINGLLEKCDIVTLEAVRNALESMLNEKLSHENPKTGIKIPFKM